MKEFSDFMSVFALCITIIISIRMVVYSLERRDELFRQNLLQINCIQQMGEWGESQCMFFP